MALLAIFFINFPAFGGVNFCAVKLVKGFASTGKNTLTLSPLPSHGAEKGRGVWENTPEPVAAARGELHYPLVTVQAARGQQLHAVQMVRDRCVFCQNKGLHREKQLSRFQKKLLLVTEMIGRVHRSN